MDINAVASRQNTPPMPAQMAKALDSSATQTEAVENSLPVKTPPSEAEAFYTYKEKPWLTEPGYEHVTSREQYVSIKKTISEIDLALMQVIYDRFRNQLADVNPELAKKNFGFTLGADANLKIISYDDSLTEAERSTLSELINNFESLKSAIQDHAKTIMTLVDHDHETFGAGRNITLENFQDIIDYSKVLNRSPHAMQDEWIRQARENAEPKGPAYISVDA